MAEVRNMREGEMWWVMASGSGSTFATASAPTSGLFGYCRSFDFTSAQTVARISERGTPNHNKVVDKQYIPLNINFGWTGSVPTFTSGSGASVPMIHIEHKAKAPEIGTASGFYHQFFGVAADSFQWTEGAEENTVALTCGALAMNGPTASGYIK